MVGELRGVVWRDDARFRWKVEDGMLKRRCVGEVSICVCKRREMLYKRRQS